MGDLPPEEQMHVPVPDISVEKLMGIIEKMNQLTDDERAEIMQNLRRRKAELEGKVLPDENAPFITYEFLIIIILVTMIVYIISLFAYRIYKDNQKEQPGISGGKIEKKKGKKIT